MGKGNTDPEVGVLAAQSNTEQAEAWNGDDGLHWAQHRDRYDTMLHPHATRLLHAAAIAPGQRVLDIGCGCGETTCRAARQAGPGGGALGVDLSGPMLDEARRRAARELLSNVSFEQADVQAFPFEAEAFDVAISRFGVMFFDDPHAAFVRIHQALRPGGRLAFLCWQDVMENDHLVVPFSAIARYVPLPELGGPGRPGPFSLADPERIRESLADAGFTGISIEPVTEPMWLGTDADDATGFLQENPTARTMLKDADEQTVANVRQALREALATHQTADGVALGSAAWLVTAER
jgi:SAM-dependent methyltransferase